MDKASFFRGARGGRFYFIPFEIKNKEGKTK